MNSIFEEPHEKGSEEWYKLEPHDYNWKDGLTILLAIGLILLVVYAK